VRVCELICQVAAKNALFARLFLRDCLSGVSTSSWWTEAGHIALIIDENDPSGRPEQFQGASTCFWVEFLATPPRQAALQEVAGEQYEDNLVDDKIRALRRDRLQVGEALSSG
jgi:hypothetical protein